MREKPMQAKVLPSNLAPESARVATLNGEPFTTHNVADPPTKLPFDGLPSK